jgi:hypothetical protein
VLLVAGGACLSAGWQLAHALMHIGAGFRTAALVAHYDRERFAALKDLLPPQGVLGFRADDACTNPVQTYYLAQYSLAPRLVVTDPTRRPLIIDGEPFPAQNPMDGRTPRVLLAEAP